MADTFSLRIGTKQYKFDVKYEELVCLHMHCFHPAHIRKQYLMFDTFSQRIEIVGK